MSPSKAKGTNLTNRREGTVGNRREERSDGFLLQVVLNEATATREGFGDLAARGGGVGRKVGVLSTVAIKKREREQQRDKEQVSGECTRLKN